MKTLMLSSILSILCWQAVYSQTTSFSYQGKLNVSGSPANGNFDFEFKLFDAASGGTQQGATVQRLNVAAANGIYSVSLDFGAAALPGADRFLDIAVRTAGGGAFIPLAPRQQITSTPYAVRSLSAATADSVVVAGVPSGSGNYIQNTTSPQAASNFNISGNGIIGGNVGIGTANPAYRLSILNAGEISIHTKSSASWNSIDVDAQNGDAALRFLRAGVFQWLLRNRPEDDSLEIFELGAGSRMTIQNGTGNFGIGTTTPGYKLHVVGETLRVEGNTTGTFPRYSLNFTGGGADAKKWQNYATTNSLVFSALNDAENGESFWQQVNRGSGTSIASVTFPNGNVGVGTNAPNAKLQVAGGNVYIQNPNSLIITSPNGACWFITVSNTGALSTVSATCP